MKIMKRQRGMTGIGWLAILGLMSIIVLAALRLFPVYMDAMSIGSAVESLEKDADVFTGVNDVRSRLDKRFAINNIGFLTRDDVKITRDGSFYLVDVDYESRVPFMYNIDFVVSFSYSSKARSR